MLAVFSRTLATSDVAIAVRVELVFTAALWHRAVILRAHGYVLDQLWQGRRRRYPPIFSILAYGLCPIRQKPHTNAWHLVLFASFYMLEITPTDLSLNFIQYSAKISQYHPLLTETAYITITLTHAPGLVWLRWTSVDAYINHTKAKRKFKTPIF